MSVSFWFGLLLVIFFLGALTSNAWLVIIAVVTAVFLGLAMLWNRHSLDQVDYTRRFHYRRGFPGEETDMQLRVENRKFLPLSWLRISDTWPDAVAPSDERGLRKSHLPGFSRLENLYSLRWFEKITRSYRLRFRERGVYPVGPSELSSGDLFGLFEQREMRENAETLTVFPELLPLRQLSIETENPMGENRSRRHLFEDPNQPMGVRAYHPEDEFRRIHWPATARTGELQVKVFQPVNAKTVVICVNIATSAQPWLGINHELAEHIIKLAATLCYQHIQQGYSVGLISNSCLSHSDQPFIIQPGRSTGQLSLLLESLARVTFFITTPFETFLARTLPKLPFGASLVIVSASITENLYENLIRIKRYRSNTTLISLDPSPPVDIPGVHTLHLPYQYKKKENPQ